MSLFSSTVMSEETLDLDKLSLEDSYLTVGINGKIEKSGILASSHTETNLQDRKHYKNVVVDHNYPKGCETYYEELQPKVVSSKRKHKLEKSSDEQMEKMARLMIEDSMSLALIRRCWKCKQSFVKEGECTAVRCECGAVTCYSCGQYITNNLVTAHLQCAPSTSAGDDRERVRWAAVRAKRALRATYPSLTFKYDPSGCEDWLS